jgi:catechol 2,3-dioxygenase-like lactoylglutathione lyase family enzyme
MNVFYNTIIFVRDISISRIFYENIIGLKAENDYGTIVFFENNFVIHNGNDLLNTVFRKKPLLNLKKGKKNLEIYLETDDINESYEKIKNSGARIIHGIEKQEWGQKVFRFFDPDNHIVEIGEALHLEYLKK